MDNQRASLYGMLAKFNTVSEIYSACEKVRDAGFQRWDAYTPFPIHGLEKAAGLPQSKLPWIVAGTAFIFGVGGFSLWSWMNAVDYKYIIAGKPFYSWPAYFLPGFECAVLSAAFACLIGMLALNKLPRWHHPLFSSEMFLQATNDKFFISIEATDPCFNPTKTMEFLKSCGASQVEFVGE